VRQLGRSSRYELLVHKDGVAANLRDVGVGVAQVLPVLTVAYSVPPGSTVLLEEPEIHLHPLAQAVLAELFADVQAFTQRVMTGSVQTKAQAAKAPAGGGGTGVGLDLLPSRVRHQNADFAFLVKPLPCESTTYAHFCGSFVVATA